MRIIVKMLVAVIVALITMCLLIMADMPDNIVIPAYFFTGISLCLAWGVFDDVEKRVKKYESIKHRNGLKEAA